MSKELDQNTEVTTENVTQDSPEQKEVNTVPSYRLREETAKRRDAENKLDAFEKAEQKRTDADLGWEAKHTKLSAEFTTFKDNAAKQTLNTEFTSKMVEAGLPAKIAKVAIPSDLSDDNMGGKVKEAVKEFAEFIPKKDETKPNSALGSVQPNNSNDDLRNKNLSMGDLARQASGQK